MPNCDDNLTPGVAAAGGLYQYVTSARPERLRVYHQLRAPFFLATVIVALNWYAPFPLTPAERFYASAMIALMAIPAWLWKSGFDRSVPFFLMVVLTYVYYFALPVFLLRKFSLEVWKPGLPTASIEYALEYSFVGISCMLLGYFGPLFAMVRPVMPRLKLNWGDPRAIRIAGIVFSFAGLCFATTKGKLPQSLAQVGDLGADLCTVGVCTLLLLQLLGQLNRTTKILLWGFLIPVRLGIGLSTGSAAGPFGIALTLVVTYAAFRRRISWPLIMAGTLVLFVIRPLELPYRAAVWQAGGRLEGASMPAKLEYLGELAYRATLEAEIPFDSLIQISGLRLAQFTLFAEVIRDTPANVPYWGGSTYYPMLFKLVPRLLYEDKPEEITGQTFGHRYGLIFASDSGTSLNLPQLIELYANFGLTGVILGMTLFGFLYRLLIELFVHREMGFGALIGAIMMTGITDVGSAASLAWGGLPWLILFVVAISLFVQMLTVDFGTMESAAAHV